MYRLLTEDTNRDRILTILDSHIDGYTVTPVLGAWKGQRENSLAIDIVNESPKTVHAIAEEIKRANSQESVLVLDLGAVATFI